MNYTIWFAEREQPLKIETGEKTLDELVKESADGFIYPDNLNGEKLKIPIASLATAIIKTDSEAYPTNLY